MIGRRGLLAAALVAAAILFAPVSLAFAQRATGVYICSKCGRSYTGGGACPSCYPPSSSSSSSGSSGATSGYDPNSLMMETAGQFGSALGKAVSKWLFEDPETRGREEAAAARRAEMAEAVRRLEEARRREEEERRRVEEARRLEEQRLSRVRDAARMRVELDRREKDMTERLEGLFDVAKPNRTTPFFGAPGTPDPASGVPPIPRARNRSRSDSRADLEARLRSSTANATWTMVRPEDAIVIGGETPLLTPDQIRRAGETSSFGGTPWRPDSDLVSNPRLDAARRIAAMGRDDLADLALEESERFKDAWGVYKAQSDLAGDLGMKLESLDLSNPDVEMWAGADWELGAKFLRSLWGEPSLEHQEKLQRLKEYREQFHHLLFGSESSGARKK